MSGKGAARPAPILRAGRAAQTPEIDLNGCLSRVQSESSIIATGNVTMESSVPVA